jgi:energy-coupling factor transport system ATP-binding protein
MDRGCIVYDGRSVPTQPEQRAARPVCPEAPSEPPVVEIQGLTLDYGGSPVVRDLMLQIQAGEFVALMGDNGSGKTTLLRAMLGLAKPSSGQVRVVGRDTRQTPVSELARDIGYVFQNPDHQLFCDSVWQEAILSAQSFSRLDDAAEAQIAALLERCGLAARRAEHPHRLSYGEKRRLNLVSILGHGPRVILLDEPLIGQDAANVAFLMRLLCERVARGASVVMVNHNPEVTRRYADRLLFLSEGQVLVDDLTDAGFDRLAALGRDAYMPAAPQASGGAAEHASLAVERRL